MSDALDLYDLALLLSYERFTLEPRFRHTKLVDMAVAASPFQTLQPEIAEWNDPDPLKRARRWGYVYRDFSTSSMLYMSKTPVRDLPSNMLLDPHPPYLQLPTAAEKETAFYQPRALYSARESVVLIRYLLDLFDASAEVRIRTPRGETLYARAQDLRTRTYTLSKLRSFVLSLIMPHSMSACLDIDIVALGDTKSDPVEHSVLIFQQARASSLDDPRPIVLDLSSIQFGTLGRGLGGRALFALEAQDAYDTRLRSVADEVVVLPSASPPNEREEPRHDWLRDVAAHVKARYDRRATEGWCGHCGAPGTALSLCARCGVARFCSREHQLAAWPMHKLFCVPRQKKEKETN
ncbi:hypothetical protein EXIGLDRAFT_839483 [Exidia glandulosa HHB12029]|uniref:MYND-type domain-containing protein n=1 Tax=Exidia glandulosa HHB12029 TaxID=1314781 RepID=A0A166A3A6_EXIGL|nr:hypothetical protein EXIGLDRAFT_839483 [Exidia glandulosa HHB12029]